MTAFDIGVLGELTVRRDGTPVPVTGSGRQALLGLLADNTDRVVPLERIVDGLWGAAAPVSAIKVVQTHVSQLRRLLEPDRDANYQVLVTRPSGYELAVGADAVDAARFEAAVDAAFELPAADAVDPLREALALWRGPPFAGIDRPFAVGAATRLEQLRISARSRCLAGELARGRHREVEVELRALVAEHPLNEALVELLMLALYRSGQQADALAVHAELRHRLADELGADPAPSLSALHERILRHDPSLDLPTPAASVAGETPSDTGRHGNLPPPRSSFVGRQKEVPELAAMASRNRLTTVVGAGGAGKTRVALRAAAEAAATFDSVWLVALGTLDDGGHLDGHCLTELGIIDQMDRPPIDTLRGWIGDRYLLLVLDNCEHVAEAVAELIDQLLTTCPRLHLLATSRQPLHSPGEHQWRVPTLGLPDAPDAASVAASEAGTLFVDRATEARPGFELDATTAPSVFQICRRLDGIPLAIELAAVRMATMSATELAAGLDNRFQLLTSGNRTALPRHRTLLATTDWSYDLLQTEEQHLLGRLSAFVADFSVDAAVDVCGWEPLEQRHVPGLVADLVDHSLVEVHELEGRTRYRLLETVREYGREQLGDDEVETLGQRYGDWAARLAESAGANAHEDTATWYARLDREFLHVQATFAAAMRRGDAETALRLAAGSGWALIIIGRFHRLREWLRQAVALARQCVVDDRVLAQGLMMSGAVAGIDHRFDRTLDLLDEARERFEAVGSVEGALWTGYWRSATLAEMGELDAALSQIEETVEEAASRGTDGLVVGDPADLIEASARAEQAELIIATAVARGRLEQDLADAGRALSRARELADVHEMQELSARVGLTEVFLTALRGEPAEALSRSHQRLDAWRKLGRGNRLILGLVSTAKVALLAERPEEARPLVSEAVGLIGEFAWSAPLRGAAEVVVVLSEAHDPAAAATLLGAAEARAPTHRWRMPTDLTEVRARLRDTLGPQVSAERHAEGGALDLDQVVALASTTVAALPDGG